MKSRILQALVLTAALGSTALIAVHAIAQQGPGPRFDHRQGPRPGSPPRMSPEDRAAFLDAHIAAMRAGLKLTPQQDAMWPAVEQAARDGMTRMQAMREQARSQPRPADPIEGMRRMADAAAARGEVLHKIVEAAQPLYASLSDDQKRRLPLLMRGPRGDREPMRGPRMGGDMGPQGRFAPPPPPPANDGLQPQRQGFRGQDPAGPGNGPGPEGRRRDRADNIFGDWRL